jgi:hypothetical protein
MIELNSTWNTVVMLLVAGGVGLIGGIGAALIEWKRDCALAASGSTVKRCSTGWNVVACVVLGGIAAVAILYFFPPTTTEVVRGESTSSYDLTKLVALALIVGSAGAAFLQALQTRALALTAAERADAAVERADAVKATATEALDGIAKQAEKATEAQVHAAGSELQGGLQGEPLKAKQAAKVLDDFADKAGTAVADALGAQAATAMRMVDAAAGEQQQG